MSISETIDEIGELEESHPVTDHPINKLKMDLIGQVDRWIERLLIRLEEWNKIILYLIIKKINF